MTDTYSSPTQSSTSAAISPPAVDPHQAAQDRLAALLEELKADQLKPVAPKPEEVQELPVENTVVQRPKSGLTQSKLTIEEQLGLNSPYAAGAYGQLMKKLNQKYRQSSPSLVDLLGMLKPTTFETSAQPAGNKLIAPLEVDHESTPIQGFDSPEFLTALSKLPDPAENLAQTPVEGVAPVAQTGVRPRIVSSYLRKLSTNLKQFGKLDLASFHAAK